MTQLNEDNVALTTETPMVSMIQSLFYSMLLYVNYINHEEYLTQHPDFLLTTIVIFVIHTGFYNNPWMQSIITYIANKKNSSTETPN
jgi:hypothetical protein